MKTVTLRADCTHCAALCCIALAFDRSTLFAFDKQAGEACAHLDSCGGCRIHSEREARGFRGCIGYDCRGAGQYVTEILFGGRSWMDDRALVKPMSDAFAIVRELHSLVLVLRRCQRLRVPAATRGVLCSLEETLTPRDDWTIADVRSEQLARRMAEARRILASLKPLIGPALLGVTV